MKRKSRSELRSEATHQALIDAARELFTEKGMDLATIDDITSRADVGKGTFYYHFDNKNELIRELLQDIMQQLCDEIDTRSRDAEGLEALLDQTISAHLEFFHARRDDFILYFQGRADMMLQEGYQGIDEPIFLYLERLAQLIAGITNHHLSTETLKRITNAVAGFVTGYFAFASISVEEQELQETFGPLRKTLVASLSRYIREELSREKSLRSSEAGDQTPP
ncbi:MAG: TetR/AcrR family transcriptional regulator [Trueperaceae bacterium]|nr:MAG: TetR/AcrR family transcriptional regulator [Trueperaceae bacterium]